ncbi:MAG: hypothetical protein QM791_22415 [Ferruginibacter sp.]
MTDELNTNNQLAFSPGEGWAQMEAMLNKSLPVNKKNSWRLWLLHCIPCILLSLIFMLSSLQLDVNKQSKKIESNELAVAAVTPAGNHIAVSLNKNYLVTKRSLLPSINTNKPFITITGNTEIEPVTSITIAAIKRLPAGDYIENTITSIIKNKSKASGIKSTPANTKADLHTAITPGKKDRYKKHWELAAGVAVNLPVEKQQGLQPYPTAEIKYNLSPNVFIAGGISLFSTATGNVSGISKTLYVNDTVNNIRLYNEEVNYSHFRYADIPVSVGFNISRSFALQAGLQASVLLSKTKSKSLKPYDFQMNDVNAPLNPAVTARAEQEFNIQVRNMDYRFIGGIKYKVNKLTAGLFYQQGLQSPGAGINTSAERNNFFTVNLLYRIK